MAFVNWMQVTGAEKACGAVIGDETALPVRVEKREMRWPAEEECAVIG